SFFSAVFFVAAFVAMYSILSSCPLWAGGTAVHARSVPDARPFGGGPSARIGFIGEVCVAVTLPVS
ncbi:MAG: hypothetical protein AAFR20_11515, partial [Pseudomonadota bacterium]